MTLALALDDAAASTLSAAVVLWRSPPLAAQGRALPPPARASAPRAVALPPTAEALPDPETLRRSAFDDGFQAGLRLGEQQRADQARALAEPLVRERVAAAQALAQQQLREELERLREAQSAALQGLAALIERLPAEVERALHAAEDELVALAHAAVCRLLGREATTAQAVRSQVREALRAWQGESPLAVHLHPQDVMALQSLGTPEQMAHGLAGLPPDLGLRWIADDGVELGGCVLRSPGASLDARLQVQWETLRARLLDARAGQTQGEGA